MNGLAPVAAPAGRAPGLMRRMASLVYEALLLFGIGLIPGAIGALFVALGGTEGAPWSELALQAIAVAIYAAYFGWFWSSRGQTLPMKTWQIRVVTAQGEPLTPARALARFVASCAWVAPAVVLAHLNRWSPRETLAAVGVGVIAYALLALLHPQRQFWHDALCRTRLVDARPAAA
jgi:uncharacterized RDD family membrane protein YckC